MQRGEDKVDLLWFPTGGGKTEAYLAIVAFYIIWRRLNFEDSQNNGVNVIMRYTLRLLTSQQFERTSRLVCALEIIRNQFRNELKDSPITIGLWVGNQVTPGKLEEASKIISENTQLLNNGKKIADDMGYPDMIKASAGGGGKGMRIVEKEEDFLHHFETASQEAKNAFGDDTMYIEKYIPRARHIEFQILADKYGNVIHLGERDCSIQRRHQKMIEEAPSFVINEELRQKMGDTAVKAAKAANYCNAGTIEFILDQQNNFYFIEMNTRIQVEHGVTEMVTGIDLIREQIKVANGEKLSISQEDIKISGHSIECRINAENPSKNFMPSPGLVTSLHFPGGNGVRIDSALYSGYKIPSAYDSLIVKLMVHDATRELAIQKMRGVLGELVIEGIDTNIDFQYKIINHEDYIQGKTDTGFVERLLSGEI
jgi:acetyl-CoA carboxylase biotin carboxylase subunit